MKKYAFLIGFILWMCLIFNLSNQDGGTSLRQSNIVVRAVEDFPIFENLGTEKISVIVRKSAHFFVYFVMAMMLYPFIRFIKKDTKNLKSVLYTLLAIFLYACSDEIHQIFVDGREAHFTDVLIDSSGGITGILVSTSLSKLVKNQMNYLENFRKKEAQKKVSEVS